MLGVDRRGELKEVYSYYIIHGVMMYREGWRPGGAVSVREALEGRDVRA